MIQWPFRYQLSMKHRLRRSVYEVLRDQLDAVLIDKALVDSYRRFRDAGVPYPFVAKRELKPRARVAEREHILQNHFLIIFCEGSIPPAYKKYIRFFDSNKVTKEGVSEFVSLPIHKCYTHNLRFFENPGFFRFMLDLTGVDYALLIQQHQMVKRLNRYALSHFHVRVDWPIDDAAEDLAQSLRYISKDLYERGEEYAEHLHQKLFENHGFHHTVGGRRTAAVIAAQLLRRMDFISTVYVASCESRTLTRISERGISKYVLVQIPAADIAQICAREGGISVDRFRERYLVDSTDEYGIGILHVAYRHTSWAKPPDDGRLRRLRTDYQWLTVSDQLLLPLYQDFPEEPPLPYRIVYT